MHNIELSIRINISQSYIRQITISLNAEEENAIEDSFIIVNITEEGLKIPPKQNILTEAIPFEVKEGTKILVSFYLSHLLMKLKHF